MTLRIVQFLAIILTALALVPGGAHLFAMPNKIDLAQDPYFMVQGIYRGWALFGAVIMSALACNALAAFMLRDQRVPCALALVAALSLLATLAIFFIWTYPANVATDNWTAMPANWREWRNDWEYSHAINAAITFVALCAITLSALTASHPD
jgi:hypothetical protein